MKDALQKNSRRGADVPKSPAAQGFSNRRIAFAIVK